jgi:addiction module RelB/DinJ family antitoxin
LSTHRCRNWGRAHFGISNWVQDLDRPTRSVVRARIDERTKREAAAALKKIGLTLSDAFRRLLVRVAAEKALPFEPLNPNAETVAARMPKPSQR